MGTKETTKLDLAVRTVQKKKVRALRRQGIIPCVIYGKDFEPKLVQVKSKDFELVYKKSHGTNIIEASLESKKINVLIQEIQRDNMSRDILHVDLLKVDMKRDVSLEVPLTFIGESPAEKDGKAKIGHETTSISIKCSPTNIPSEITVDVSLIKDKHDVIHASDLILPKGASLAHGVSEDKIIATLVPVKIAEVEPTEEEEQTEGEAEQTENKE